MSNRSSSTYRLPSFEELTLGEKPSAEGVYSSPRAPLPPSGAAGRVALPSFEELVPPPPPQAPAAEEPEAEEAAVEERLPTPQELLEQAAAQADELLAQANEQAQALLAKARQDAQEELAQGKMQLESQRDKVYAEERERGKKDTMLEIARVTGLLESAISAYQQERDEIYTHIERRLTETTLAVMRLTFRKQLEETPQSYAWLIEAAMEELGQSKPTVLKLSTGAYNALMNDPNCRGARAVLESSETPFLLDKTLPDGEVVAEVDEGSVVYGVDALLQKLEDKLLEADGKDGARV